MSAESPSPSCSLSQKAVDIRFFPQIRGFSQSTTLSAKICIIWLFGSTPQTEAKNPKRLGTLGASLSRLNAKFCATLLRGRNPFLGSVCSLARLSLSFFSTSSIRQGQGASKSAECSAMSQGSNCRDAFSPGCNPCPSSRFTESAKVVVKFSTG